MLESIQVGGAEVVADGHVAAVDRKVEAVGALQVEPPWGEVVEHLKTQQILSFMIKSEFDPTKH